MITLVCLKNEQKRIVRMLYQLFHRRWLLCNPAEPNESYNLECAGLGNPRAFRELWRLIAEKDPTLLFLSKTKKRRRRMQTMEELAGLFREFHG